MKLFAPTNSEKYKSAQAIKTNSEVLANHQQKKNI